MFDEILGYALNQDTSGYPGDDPFTHRVLADLYAMLVNGEREKNIIFAILELIDAGNIPWDTIIEEMEDCNY